MSANEHTSGRHLIQSIDEDDFSREFIASSKGTKKSTFFEAINSRGLEQLQYIYEQLQAQASAFLPSAHIDDALQAEGKHFICRIKAITTKNCIQSNPVPEKNFVFYDAVVLLGTPGINQSEKPLRVVGYRIGQVNYWIATDRFDLSAEQVVIAYKLR